MKHHPKCPLGLPPEERVPARDIGFECACSTLDGPSDVSIKPGDVVLPKHMGWDDAERGKIVYENFCDSDARVGKEYMISPAPPWITGVLHNLPDFTMRWNGESWICISVEEQ